MSRHRGRSTPLVWIKRHLVPEIVGTGAWLLGELAADVVFNTIAVASFEAGRRLILPHSFTIRKAHSS